ncbi:uncharacterized protein CXQ87_003306 [Candidozyma duobushaemuli]|uniref:Chromosome segregation in meiosis protein 3 domain-containing protein n=1 Tax=Candidozyma duobushaemuli TaxID=1231522 RepID=A0A2V1ACP5_9ASCO|nr:uncharacterized protein CXQ87_003306 [[Candida] duobushaemulonis]PVH15465.1 hypothetical protein CXQ87_003306 [[Candida] duobushaemulonis]
MKLGRVSKIPKITDELMFNPTRGLPMITKNYKKLSRTIKRNDKKLQEKLKTEKSKSAAKRAKVEAECENLGTVIQFYQFWAHGFFPEPTSMTAFSARIKEYRRSLLDNELRKLKIEKGIIVEGEDEPEPPTELDNDDLYTGPEPPAPTENNNSDLEEDDGDWGFMNVNNSDSNGLFVGDNDKDLDAERPSNPVQDSVAKDSFDDEFAPDEEMEDDYEAELAAMREMGM